MTTKKDDHSLFISKFKDQIESIGKDGIIGLMKSAHLSVSHTDPCFNGPLGKWNELYAGSSRLNKKKEQKNKPDSQPQPIILSKLIKDNSNHTPSNDKNLRARNNPTKQLILHKSFSNSNRDKPLKVVLSQNNSLKKTIKHEIKLPLITNDKNKSQSTQIKKIVIKPNQVKTTQKKRDSQMNNNMMLIKDDLKYLNEIKRQNNLLLNNNAIVNKKNENQKHFNQLKENTNYQQNNLNLNTIKLPSSLFIPNKYTNSLSVPAKNVITLEQPDIFPIKLKPNKKTFGINNTKKELGVIKEEDELNHNDEIKNEDQLKVQLIKNTTALNINDMTDQTFFPQRNNNIEIENQLSDIEKLIILRKSYKPLFLQS